MKIRVGFGFDVHQLVTGRELWLGGIKFEHELGLLGHSDADVLIHAICDALLGAANMRDIGYHFPDTAGEFKNIDSKILLAETVDLIAAKGYKVGNVDATICAERPKLKARIPEMQLVLAHLMRIDVDDVSVKATTTEKLGFTGREEGISAYATVLIEKAECFVALYWEISSGKILLEDYRIRPNASNTPNSSILREVSPNMLFNSFPLLIFTILCHAMK